VDPNAGVGCWPKAPVAAAPNAGAGGWPKADVPPPNGEPVPPKAGVGLPNGLGAKGLLVAALVWPKAGCCCVPNGLLLEACCPKGLLPADDCPNAATG
jgi:hypothetical protein